MDVLIRGTTFAHDDANEHNNFNKAVTDIINQHNRERDSGSPQDVLQALSSLQAKLTKEAKPSYKTKGWEQATSAFKNTVHLYRALNRKDRVKESDVYEGYYTIALSLLQNGLSMLHMQIAFECFQGRDISLKDYIQKLDSKMLKPLISAICEKVQMEHGVEGKDFGDMYQKLLRQILRDTFTKEQVLEFKSELLDHAVRLYLDYHYLQEDAYKRLTDTGKNIMDTLADPFTEISDVEQLRSYIKHCGETFKQAKASFPSSKSAARYTKDFMGLLVTKLGKRGLVEEIYSDIFDLIMDVSKCPSDDDAYVLSLFSEAYGYFRRLPKDALTKNPDLFLKMATRFTDVLEQLDIKFILQERFSYTVVDDVLVKLYANNKQVARQWVELLIPLLKRPCEDTMRACRTIMSADKSVKWKEHPEVAHQVFELICAFQPPEEVEEEEEGDDKEKKEKAKKRKDFLQYFHRFVTDFLEGLKKSKMLKDYRRDMLSLSMKYMEVKDSEMLELSENIAERIELNPKEDKEVMMETMKRFHVLLKNEDHLWNMCWPLQRAANDLIDSCLEPFKDGKVFTDEELSVFVSICMTCLSYDCVHPETGQFPSHYFSVYLTVMKMLNKWLGALNKMDLAAAMVPPLIKYFEIDDSNVSQLCAVYIYLFAQSSSGQKIVAPYLEELIQIYLDKEEGQLLQAITEVYPSNPKALKSHYRTLMDLLEESGDPVVIMYLAQLFQKVSKKQAELFTDQDIEILIHKSQENVNSQTMLLDIAKELCKRRPDSMIPHIDLLLDRSSWSPMVNYWITEMLCVLALYKKDLAPKVLDDLFDSVKTSQDKSVLLTSFNTIRTIGFKYPDLLKPRRAEISALQLTDVDASNMRQLILDMIDGKTSDDMLDQLQRQQQDIQSLVGRVDETEEAVAEVRDELGRQSEQLDNVKNEIGEQGQRLDEVEKTVDETVAKVEEIDQKTLSHAPFWARDISRLLNPVSDHDWRLLSSRLGYSNNDIRGWAQQADPCMAMLNEWYATRKTSEATFAVLTQLQEMDRMDAAIIVENAMKNAEAVVEDEEFEYASPPPIFISYQWAHQPEVRLLKQHLEMAGYECWLDVGQMGGGDKLFEKIDNGVRAAKIIISCVTTKYAKSPNCNREVNLAVSLNKPVIPLLLEKCTWPPPGSMGPIFSEYLFIRFFQRQGEELEDQRYWAKDKFQELLMQLNMFGLGPEEGKIEPEYKDWWLPVAKEIKIDKSKTRDGGQETQVEQSDADRKAAESPDVFISYQWGKQKNVIKLYERLTSLGLTCWLDIKQMGGGDSLYDKIDRGVRGSKVVLCCVTQKYALSANCRREVSLADALKKPLLPLLLEQMTWPPVGPMSMVMAQLLYINFAKDELVQMTWDGPQFQELLSKIHQYVPEDTIKKDTSVSHEKSSKFIAKSDAGVPNRTAPAREKGTGSSPSVKQQLKSNTTPLRVPPGNGFQSSQSSLSKVSQPQPGASVPRRQYVTRPPLSSPSSSSSSSAAGAAQPQPRGKPTQQANSTRKPPLAKLSAVGRLSSLSKSSPRASPARETKVEPLELPITSRRLLKPLPSDSPKSQPTSDTSIPSKVPARPPPSKQSKTATHPRASQRPSRLPPLQHSRPYNSQPPAARGKPSETLQPASNGPSSLTRKASK